MTEVIVPKSRLSFFRGLELSNFIPNINKLRFVGNGDVEIVAMKDIIHVVVLCFAEGDRVILEVDFECVADGWGHFAGKRDA